MVSSTDLFQISVQTHMDEQCRSLGAQHVARLLDDDPRRCQNAMRSMQAAQCSSATNKALPSDGFSCVPIRRQASITLSMYVSRRTSVGSGAVVGLELCDCDAGLVVWRISRSAFERKKRGASRQYVRNLARLDHDASILVR